MRRSSPILPTTTSPELSPMRTEKSRPALAPQLVGVAAQLVAQVQRRVAGPLGVVLVGDGRAEERHDPVAGVLVDRALEAVHAVGQDLEEAVQDRGATPRGRPARPAPASPSRRRRARSPACARPRGRTCSGGSCRPGAWGCSRGGCARAPGLAFAATAVAAAVAELRPRRELGLRSAAQRRSRSAAPHSPQKLASVRVLVSAGRAVHSPSSFASRSAWPVAPISV